MIERPAILVVEDDPVIRGMLAEYLADLGYVVSAAEDGESAVRDALAHPPSLVLVDLMLPRVGGLEVARRLRADLRERQVSILAMSAVSSRGTAEECRRAGCDAFLPKPFDLDVLEAQIARCLHAGLAAKLRNETGSVA